MPAIIQPVSGWSGGEPEGQQADDEAEQVHQQVGSIRHYSKAAGEVATCGEQRSKVITGWLEPTGTREDHVLQVLMLARVPLGLIVILFSTFPKESSDVLGCFLLRASVDPGSPSFPWEPSLLGAAQKTSLDHILILEMPYFHDHKALLTLI